MVRVRGWGWYLAVHRIVPAPTEDLGTLLRPELLHVDLMLPEAPAPVLAILGGGLPLGDRGQAPGLTAIGGDLDTDHLGRVRGAC